MRLDIIVCVSIRLIMIRALERPILNKFHDKKLT